MSSAFPSGDDIEVSPAESADALARGAATLVDVREDDEWHSGYVDGSVHIPLGRLTAEAQSIPQDRPVVFVCHSGVRSLMAAEAFRAAGFDARSMAGGVLRWSAEGRALAPEGGSVAPH